METNRFDAPQDWGMYMQQLEDKPAVTRVNIALNTVAPVDGYRYRLQLAVYYRTPTENGLPVAEENPELWKIEDAFVELLNKVDAIDAGLMKWNNRVNFFFYVKVADVGDELVKGLKEQFPDYEYKLWVDEDEQWEGYFLTLFPNKYSMQEIQNNKVLSALDRENDDLGKERVIEHFLLFKDEAAANRFVEKVAEKGFVEFHRSPLEDNEYKLQIGVSRPDIPDNIHNITWYLLDEVEEAGGYYDGWGCGMA